VGGTTRSALNSMNDKGREKQRRKEDEHDRGDREETMISKDISELKLGPIRSLLHGRLLLRDKIDGASQ
jgi:hypothetical protein